MISNENFVRNFSTPLHHIRRTIKQKYVLCMRKEELFGVPRVFMEETTGANI